MGGSTISRARLPMMGSGRTISLWDSAYSITSIPSHSIQDSTTPISTLLMSTGPNLKVNGSHYLGDFADDLKQGQGKLFLSNGEYFEGEFDRDAVNG